MTMAGVHIVERVTKAGERRFLVRMSGSRFDPITHLGTFDSRREAESAASRARLILEEGEVPSRAVVGRHRVSVKRVLFAEAAAAWEQSIGHGRRQPTTVATYRALLRHGVEAFGERDVRSITRADLEVWMAGLPFEARSVPKYRRVVLAVLEHADVDVSRLRKAEAPHARKRRYRLPSRAELDALYPRMRRDHALAVLLLEHTGLRVGEAARLRWDDVQRSRKRFRVLDAKTAAGERWVDDLDSYPAELVAHLSLPPGEQPGGLVLGGLSGDAVAAAMRYGCERAGIPVYSPHDLRHRHISMLFEEGWSAIRIAARVGHAKPSITQDVYGHLIAPD
jgi:integrase